MPSFGRFGGGALADAGGAQGVPGGRSAPDLATLNANYPPASNAGASAYVAGVFYDCDGTSWNARSAGGAGVASGVIDAIKAYSLDITGATDASVGINAAITAAAASPLTTGDVYIGPGVYRLNSPIRPKSGVRLRGAGMGRTKLVPYGEICAITPVTQFTAAVPFKDAEFSDFEIDGSNQTAAVYDPSTTKGIFIQNHVRVVYKNLYIHDTGATGLGVDFFQKENRIEGCWVRSCGRLNNGSQLGGSGIGIGSMGIAATDEPLTIVNNHAIGNKRYGIFFETQSANDNTQLSAGARIEGNYVESNQFGIGLSGARRTLVAGNTVAKNAGAGIVWDGGTNGGGRPDLESVVQNNTIYGNGTGVLMDFRNSSSPNGKASLIGNRIDANTGLGVALVLDAVYCSDIVIQGNTICNNGKSGIRAYYSGTTNSADIRSSRIVDNTVYSNGSLSSAGDMDGIRIEVPFSDVSVTDNAVYDSQATKTQDYGLVVTAQFVRGSVRGNDLRGNKTGAMSSVTPGNISSTTITGSNGGSLLTGGGGGVRIRNPQKIAKLLSALSRSSYERINLGWHGMSIIFGQGANNGTDFAGGDSFRTQSVPAVAGKVLNGAFGGRASYGAEPVCDNTAFFTVGGAAAFGASYGSAGVQGICINLGGPTGTISFTVANHEAGRVVRVYSFATSGVTPTTPVTARYSMSGSNTVALTNAPASAGTDLLPQGTAHWYEFTLTLASAGTTTVTVQAPVSATDFVSVYAVDLDHRTDAGITMHRVAKGGGALGNTVGMAMDSTDANPAGNWQGATTAAVNRRTSSTDSMTTRLGLAGALCSFDINDVKTFNSSYTYGWTLADHARHIANYLAAMNARGIPVLFVCGPLRNPATTTDAPYVQRNIINLYKAASDTSDPICGAAFLDLSELLQGANETEKWAAQTADTTMWVAAEAPNYVHPGKAKAALYGSYVASAIVEATKSIA
jgi:parallel beta-helix repeat protein